MVHTSAVPFRTFEFPTLPSLKKVSPFSEDMSTNAKTNDVARLILQGVGIGVATVSFVASILVSSSFLWGVAMGVGLVALSTVLDEILETAQIATGAANFIPGQPVGINNASMNCWANALLQFMRNVPSFYAHINNPSNGFGALRSFYQNYDNAQSNQQTVAANADSQSVRQWFSGRTRISPSQHRQEDASEALSSVLANFPPHVLELRRAPNGQGERVVRNQEARMFMINLNDHRNLPLDRLFIDQILHRADETQQFHKKPAELTFQLNRNVQWPARGKVDDAVNIPRRITLHSGAVMTGQGGQYECDAFISHQGKSMDGGHYVAYVLRNGQWWLCDDATIRPANMWEVDRERRKAYILHYRAV